MVLGDPLLCTNASYIPKLHNPHSQTVTYPHSTCQSGTETGIIASIIMLLYSVLLLSFDITI